jgi:hypothetical protein
MMIGCPGGASLGVRCLVNAGRLGFRLGLAPGLRQRRLAPGWFDLRRPAVWRFDLRMVPARGFDLRRWSPLGLLLR